MPDTCDNKPLLTGTAPKISTSEAGKGVFHKKFFSLPRCPPAFRLRVLNQLARYGFKALHRQRQTNQTMLMLITLAGLSALAVPLSPAHSAEPVRIGVISYRPKPQTQQQWQPLATALKQAIPERDFSVEALTLPELDLAVANHQLDFVLTNPGHYVLLARRNGLSSPLATMAVKEHNQKLTAFGGVIFSRSDAADINSLTDLKGKTIAAASTQSLGGYQMQAYELHRKGISLPQDAELLITGMPHDRIIDAVVAGHADAGFVRTGVLEAMAREGQVDISRLKIINSRNLRSFPVQVSTHLYPEWAFAALPHIDESLARHVAAALYLLEDNTTAIDFMRIHGFVIPADYSAVEDLLRELRLPPFDAAPDFTLQDVWVRYRWQLAVALLATGFFALLGFRLWRLNQLLTEKRHIVLQQKQQLQENEFRWKFAIEGSGDGLWDWNMADGTVFLSKRWKEMLGFAEDDIGTELDEFENRIHPADKAATSAALQACLDGETPVYTSEHRVRCKEGSWKWILARGMVVSRNEGGRPLRMIGTDSDITKRKTAERKLQRLTNLYAALNQCNQAIVQCNSELQLFPQICRDAVAFGGMKMAWIGLVDEHSQCLKPVAFYGLGTEYLECLQISLAADAPSGNGPSGIAIRQNQPFWCQDFQRNPATALWHERGAQFGWGASASLPLHRNDAAIGTFNLYADEAYAFDEAARNLLLEMAANIDHALNSFAQEAVRKRAEIELAESRQLLQTIIDTVPLRIFWKDRNFRYLGCNPAFARDVGANEPQDIIGKDDYQLIREEMAKLYRTDDLRLIDSNVPKLFHEVPHTSPDGKQIWLRASKVPLRNDTNETIGLLGVYEDITEYKRSEQQIQQLANFDALTGLPNRTQLDDHLKYALSLVKRNNGQLAVMFLDLDHFKDINDTLGHSVGDALLMELAKRLRSLLRAEDTVSRLGGDEFILLLPGTDAPGAAEVAEKLLTVIAGSYRIEHYDLTVTVSIGIAVYPGDGLDLETLSKNADTAMYRVKQEGRHGYRFFTQEMQARSARMLELGNALHHALERGQLHLFYQPQISVQDGAIIGAEALLRWQHPDLGHVSPAEFIPIAENNGLILKIGEWVLRSAMQQMKTWLDSGLGQMIIAVNLSAVQFRHSCLPELVTQILEEARLAPEYLELELTEGVAMNDPLGAIAVMSNLHERGIRMSIDDFGTGYSSLNYLKKFKVYKLKIDQSFVRGISTAPEDKAIIKAVIRLANSLGLKTIAEGVETAEQLDFLRDQGCDEVQGYHFSKPLPVDQFEAFVRERTRNR